MTCDWRRDGVVVVVTLARGDDDALWEAMRTRMCGVAFVDDDALTRTRVLSLPEAYYTLAEDHVLTLPLAIYSSLQAVWNDFSAASTSFASQYIVYHHFRQLGWLLRSGLNYGAQFVLYRGDPDTFHSEYIVSIASDDATPWYAVQACTRVAEDVKKAVVLCEVNTTGPPGDPAVTQARGVPGDPIMETHGQYTFHGVMYALDAVLIRYWDTATVDEDRVSYAFTPQPLLLKKSKRTPKTVFKKSNERRLRTKS